MVQNELFYTNLVLWMQANEFFTSYQSSFSKIIDKWNRRRDLLKAYAQSTKYQQYRMALTPYQSTFSSPPNEIDLRLSVDLLNIDSELRKFSYPTKPNEILLWIRSNPNEFQKKFLLFYIISEDLFLDEKPEIKANCSKIYSESLMKAFDFVIH